MEMKIEQEEEGERAGRAFYATHGVLIFGTKETSI
jgi:hypothetical protein